jgi:hypothetical protein
METYVYDTSQHLMNQWVEASESMAKVTMQLESIQEQLNSTDLASALTKLEEDITTLEKNVATETTNLRFANKSSEHNFTNVFNDIQALRTALNQLAQDPNLMSRY